MYEKLQVCYGVIFEKSYRPCDWWLFGETVMIACAIVVFLMVLKSILTHEK